MTPSDTLVRTLSSGLDKTVVLEQQAKDDHQKAELAHYHFWQHYLEDVKNDLKTLWQATGNQNREDQRSRRRGGNKSLRGNTNRWSYWGSFWYQFPCQQWLFHDWLQAVHVPRYMPSLKGIIFKSFSCHSLRKKICIPHVLQHCHCLAQIEKPSGTKEKYFSILFFCTPKRRSIKPA